MPDLEDRDYSMQEVQELLDKSKPDITIDTAADFITQNGGKVYKTQEEFESARKATAGNFKREFLGGYDSIVKEITGIEKESDEATDNYTQRAFKAYKDSVTKKDGETVPVAEYNSLKQLLETEKQNYANALENHRNLENEIFTTKNKADIQKGLDIGRFKFDNDSIKSAVQAAELSNFNSKFEIGKDDQGLYVKDLSTGNLEIDPKTMKRMSVEDVAKKYSSSLDYPLDDNRRRSTDPGSQGNSGKGLTEAERQLNNEKVFEQMKQQNLRLPLGSKEYWEHAITLGAIPSDNVKQRYNL